MAILWATIVLTAAAAIAAIRARRKGLLVTSLLLTIVAWLFLGFLLFVLIV